MDWGYAALAILGGLAAGSINTLAGNGSAITLYILTELAGLPGAVANGTNRLGILGQGAITTCIFKSSGQLNIKKAWPIAAAMFPGALLGVYVALHISNEEFKLVFRWLLVVLFFIILLKPSRWLKNADFGDIQFRWWHIPLFLCLGFYGGFIQMGMGVFFLALLVLLMRYDIMRANAVKTFAIFCYTIFVFAIFWYWGKINWYWGGLLLLGQMLGGFLTTRFAVKSTHAATIAHRVLVVVVLLALIRSFQLHEYLLQFL